MGGARRGDAGHPPRELLVRSKGPSPGGHHERRADPSVTLFASYGCPRSMLAPLGARVQSTSY